MPKEDERGGTIEVGAEAEVPVSPLLPKITKVFTG